MDLGVLELKIQRISLKIDSENLNDINTYYQKSRSTQSSYSSSSSSSLISENVKKTSSQTIKLGQSSIEADTAQQNLSQQHRQELLMQLGDTEHRRDEAHSNSSLSKRKFGQDSKTDSSKSSISESIQSGDTTSLKKPVTVEKTTLHKGSTTSEISQMTPRNYKY